MKPKRRLYYPEEFRDLREMTKSAVSLYPDNIAFIIKTKKEKEINFRNIKYSEFYENINQLGTALIDLGLHGKRVAIIGKNRYEWMLTYFAVMNGARYNNTLR